ncbi:HXXEE domain-containing protein [Enterococcus sp. DIV0086]|uniref:HXXEE domain-containing protein n=1 Tax=Enterococcus sp. DIV0086 TaxID=2774655 RepID=UPI003D266C3C
MISNFLWLPLLFIIHDFEELILVPMWIKRHQEILYKKKEPIFGGIKNSSVLSVGILEELLILVGVSIYMTYNPTSLIYFGVLTTYLIHLVLHVILCLQYKNYVPGVITALIQIPICFSILKYFYPLLNSRLFEIFMVSLVCLIIFMINILFIHKIMSYLSEKAIL